MLSTLIVACCLAANPPTWKIAEKSAVADKGNWEINYKLKNSTNKPITVLSEKLNFNLEGWVSNSIVPNHGTPRYSKMRVVGWDYDHKIDLYASQDEDLRCQEKISLTFWKDDESKETRD